MKGAFLKRKIFEDFSNVTIVSLQETHFRGENDMSQEFDDLGTVYQIRNSFSHDNDNFSGMSILLASGFEILNSIEWWRGRLLAVEAVEKSTGQKMNFVAFYGFHSGVNLEDRISLLDCIDRAFLPDENNILMGDMNFATNMIDRTGSVLTREDRVLTESMNNIIIGHDMKDSFRVLHPDNRRYTYLKGRKGSRIDKIYIKTSECAKIVKAEFHETPNEDHKVVTIEMRDEIERGKGTWCFNTDLLRDQKYITKGKDLIKELKDSRHLTKDIKEWWTWFKQASKDDTFAYCREKSRIKRNLERKIDQELWDLESRLHLDETLLHDITVLKNRKKILKN